MSVPRALYPPPAVTVIVPFRDAERTIGGLLSGLASQQPPTLGGVEFVFVDNGSTDAGPGLVEAAALPASRIVAEGKRGVSAVRNRGLAVARGEVVVCVDSDCIPSRRWLRELVAPFIDPSVHLVAGSLASFPPRTGAQRFAARYGLNDARRTLGMALPFANGRNMAVRRTSAQAVGGWPEDMVQGDDIEFSTRVTTRFGCTIEYCERALVYHQDREGDEELWAQARGYGRGIAMVYARHPERLPWGRQQHLTQLRSSTRRRVGSAWAELGGVMGFVRPDDAEFARYLAGWDRWFWHGFREERRRQSSSAVK